MWLNIPDVRKFSKAESYFSNNPDELVDEGYPSDDELIQDEDWQVVHNNRKAKSKEADIPEPELVERLKQQHEYTPD